MRNYDLKRNIYQNYKKLYAVQSSDIWSDIMKNNSGQQYNNRTYVRLVFANAKVHFIRRRNLIALFLNTPQCTVVLVLIYIIILGTGPMLYL